MNRRDCLTALAALFVAARSGPAWPDDLTSGHAAVGNFEYIYSNPELRRAFLDFLTNVFRLYPEHEFHETLSRLVEPGVSDKTVYVALQKELDEIRPFLGPLRYAIPALKKQKAVMADQTLMLLDASRRYEGHLEIGSTGRYVSALKDRIDIAGDVFLLHTQEAGFGPEDVVERGQLRKIGTHIDMGNYSYRFADIIPRDSLDLATVYIGFHHCPLEKRERFISAVRSVIRPGGTLILRDHDVRDERSRRIAALAHDAFNAGTNESWAFNENELRNFYSLRFIIDYVEKLGFRHGGQLYFQRGDPTRNGLTAFTKV